LVIGASVTTDLLHLPVLAALRDRGEVVLAQICDIERSRAAAARRKFGFLEDGSDGLAALRSPEIDAVYVFGSAQLHYEYALAALEAGKHVFVEKPIAPSYSKACEMAAAATARGLIAVGGHNRRFHTSLAAVRARAGKAGWRLAEAVFHKPEYGNAPPFGARTWLGANGIHGLDTLVFMMNGLPEQLTALAGEAGAACPSVFSAILRWRDGGQGVFLCNNNAGARREEYVFHGFGETCRLTDTALIFEKDGKVEAHPLPAADASFKAEHEAFLQAIRSGEPPPHSLAALAPSLFLAELIEGGFSGPVRLPQADLPRVELPRAVPLPRPAGESILIAQTSGLLPVVARLLPHYRLVSIDDVRQSAGPRPDIVAAILGRGSSALPADILAKLPQLAVVGIAALSLARHAPEELLARGVVVVNASSAYADSAAEFAFGLATLARRRAFMSHEVMRRGGWGTVLRAPGLRGLVRKLADGLRPALRALGLEAPFLRLWRAATPLVTVGGARTAQIRDLQGATVGLIGWGAMARVFSQLLIRANARVSVYSEHATAAEIRKAGATPVSLSEALAADIVSLHRGLTAETRHFMGASELNKLRPGAILINVARGALIEPVALLERLRQGDIFACLDTYEEEPPAASDPLRRLPNVFLTPHIAGGSRDMHVAAAEEVVRKVAACLEGEPAESVSAQRLRTMT
jgi:phosphoglycerate dehydrogenase-like enzyme/predicted dehydrogenase